jgi:hypothetical protein
VAHNSGYFCRPSLANRGTVPECIWHNSATSPKLSAVASNGASDSHKLSTQDVTRIAEAFEVSGDVVLADAALAAD